MNSSAAQVEVVHPPQCVKTDPRHEEPKRRPRGLPLTPDVRLSSDLTPGFRNRLIERLAAMGLPAEKRVSFVADLTGRAAQTVRRWFAGSNPGLPDLRSFARLCSELDISADEVIGLSRDQRAAGATRQARLLDVARCVQEMADALGRMDRLGEPLRVPGDEMAPRLCEGDLVFVEHGGGLKGNGLYAFEWQGEVIVRRVEHRHGRGWLLKCDNAAYADSEFDEASETRAQGLRLLGRVRGAIALRIL